MGAIQIQHLHTVPDTRSEKENKNQLDFII